MDKKSLEETYNNFFKPNEKITLTKTFKLQDKFYKGTLVIKTPKENLPFIIHIPIGYPFKDLSIFSDKIKGYPHQNNDLVEGVDVGKVCLNTPFTKDINKKLKLDFQKLNGWIQKYYINEESDLRYEYPDFEKQSLITLLFNESSYYFDSKRFKNNKIGVFDYTILNYQTQRQKKNTYATHISIIANNLGNKLIDEYSPHLELSKKYNSVWCYLDEEPVFKRKEKLVLWRYLVPLLPDNFFKFLIEFYEKYKDYRIRPKRLISKGIPVALGYKIPSLDSGYEIHWDIVFFLMIF